MVQPPNSEGKIETSFSRNKFFTWNKFEKGKQWVANAKLTNDNGVFTENRLNGMLSMPHSRVIGTDYTTYAVVHFCQPDMNLFTVLDGVQDQV